MSAHTPGPWKVLGNAVVDKAVDYAIGIEPDKILAEAFGRCSWETKFDSYANASLIAAAPDLLAACREFVAWCERYHGPGDVPAYVLAREAIKKAAL